MKKFLVGILLFLTSLSFSGTVDAATLVEKDLQKYQMLNEQLAQKYQIDQWMAEFENEVAQATTTEEINKTLKKMDNLLENLEKDLKTFKPDSFEVSDPYGEIIRGIQQTRKGINEMSRGMSVRDNDLINKASISVEEGVDKINKGNSRIKKLLEAHNMQVD